MGDRARWRLIDPAQTQYDDAHLNLGLPLTDRMKRGLAVGFLAGLAIAIALVAHQGLDTMTASLKRAGWRALLLPAYYLVPLVAAAISLRYLVPRLWPISFRTSIFVTWIGLAVNWLLPVAQIGGEFVRGRLLVRRGHAGAHTTAALVGDKTLQVVTQALFTIVGLCALLTLSFDGKLIALALFGTGLLALMGFAFIVAQRRGLMSGLARGVTSMMSQSAKETGAATRLAEGALRADEAVRGVYQRKGRWRTALLWRALFRFALVGETALAMWLLDAPVGLAAAIALESLGQAIRAGAFVVPAGIGVQEGGFVLIGVGAGHPCAGGAVPLVAQAPSRADAGRTCTRGVATRRGTCASRDHATRRRVGSRRRGYAELMIRAVLTAQHAYTIEQYLASPGAVSADALEHVSYREILRERAPAAATYIFTDFDRLTRRQTKRTVALIDRLRERGDRVLNDPRRWLDRGTLLGVLHERGVNAFRAHDARALPDDTRFPVFLRWEHDHQGARTPLLQRRSDVASALRGVRRRRRGRLLAIEFADTRDANGRYRKYSMFRVGDVVFPRHVFFGSSWMLKHPELLGDDELATEWAYVQANPHEGRIRAIFELAGVEYGRIDYAVRGDALFIWEINTNPMIATPDDAAEGLRAETAACFAARLRHAWETIAPSPPGG